MAGETDLDVSGASMDKADTTLRELAQTGAKRLLFYPSCGTDCGWVFSQGCDVVVCADYAPRNLEARRAFWRKFKQHIPGLVTLISSPESCRIFRVGHTIGILLFRDNNEVRERIRLSGHTISYFVGICDGCREGGNYECVNDKPFLDKVFALMHPTGMTYVTDHSACLFTRRTNFHSLILNDKLLTRTSVAWGVPTSGGWGNTVAYRVQAHSPSVVHWRHENRLLSLEHDSIVYHIHELDGAFVSQDCRDLCRFLLPNVNIRHLEIVKQFFFRPSVHKEWSTTKSLQYLLQTSYSRQWKDVGTTVFGQGDHANVMQTIREWKEPFPHHIRIFHIDPHDMTLLKTQIRETNTE